MLLNKLKYILSDLFFLDEIYLNEKTNLITDLKLDSLDFYNLKIELEENFDIEIEEVVILRLNARTIGELVQFVQAKLNKGQ